MLRQLGGQTLLLRALKTAAVSGSPDLVMVLVDDDEVALLAERHGCYTQTLPQGTLDSDSLPAALQAAAEHIEAQIGTAIDAVVVLDPAAPLIRPDDLAQALNGLSDGGPSTIVGASGAVTGSNWVDAPVIVLQRNALQASVAGRGAPGTLPLPPHRCLRLRSMSDWWVCERLLQQRRIVFVVIGYPAVGLGHVSRAGLLAHDLIHHDVHFLCPTGSELAAEQLAATGLPVHRQSTPDLAGTVMALGPDLVINDILNTELDYIARLKSDGVGVVNFEDLGPGAAAADLVVNAVFMEPETLPNHYNGPDYFCLRDEFLSVSPRPASHVVRNVLVTFGGTDDVDSTSRIARLVLPLAQIHGIHLNFVTGPGYAHLSKLTAILQGSPAQATLAHNTKRMSEFMRQADLAFSSAGRTVFELAAMRVPAVILAANPREETHTFACADNGFTYLGRADLVSDGQIVDAFERLVGSPNLRSAMAERMSRWDFRQSRRRVIDAIHKVLDGATKPELAEGRVSRVSR